MENKPGQKSRASGFSLFETVITMALFLFIMAGVYIMIAHYGDVTRTEHSRVRMSQESRYMMSAFTSEVKEAGSLLTLSHTSSFLKGKEPYFNGIFPLNNTNFPDGVIIATGDPEASTKLTQELGAGGTILTVKKVVPDEYDPSLPDYENEVLPWRAGDKGIVVGNAGFLVFAVTAVDTTGNTITTRALPVYYSGLLNTYADPSKTYGYIDPEYSKTKGNSVTYAENSPVIRLTNFSIYLFREIPHATADRNIRQFIRVTDAMGQEDVLASTSTAELSVISENIWDMQISYIAYEDFKTADRHTALDTNHHYFAGGMSSTLVSNLLADIRNRNLKQVNVGIVSLTDEFEGRGGRAPRVPRMADRPAYNLPSGKYSFKIMSVSIGLRNFNVML
jgi:Tfp pilus assembly protein PilW